jgi:hypothetical protein
MTDGISISGASLKIFRDAPSLDGRRTATLGTFSCETAEAGARAIREAMALLKAEGFEAVLGPMDGNTWAKHRLVIESDGRPSFLMEPSNPAHYVEAFEQSGLQIVSRYVSAVRSADVLDSQTVVPGLKLRQFDPAQAEAELTRVHGLSLEAFASNHFYQPIALEPFLAEAERFATGDYAAALIEGNDLPTERKQAMAEKLARYTGLTPAYILRANLRVNLGQFNRNLMDESGQTLGRLDTRFTGPSLDVLSREGEYDPQSTAISSAYVSAFNDYARGTLRYGAGKAFKLFANVGDWDLKHTPPDASGPVEGAANVLPDLAFALKTNPSLRVLVLGGYYDTATPYFEGRFQMRHLPVPEGLQGNISYKYYPSGHMVYAHEESLKALHDDVAAFVKGR